MIDSATIQKIYDAADVYEVISDFVNLKKRGVNYVGCCPFHNEKTGSFTVSPSKGIYKCFGCGKGGNVINFIMEHEQMNYTEALKYLAARYHITIEEKELSEEEKKEKSARESMLIVTNYAYEYFTEQLHETDEGKSVGLSYLKKRGLDDESIKKFGIGYSPEGWKSLTEAALAKGYKKEFLVKTGLTIESEKGLFDRFRARIIFPIRDIAGKVIAFGGRIMTKDSKAAKYLNSPESEIYHKSRTLYGIYFAKKSIIQQDCCFLVEGYLDVISFHRKGIENTVASSGTSLTIEQIRLIRRLTPNITIIYDGDEAGIKASLRGIDLVLEEGLNVKVVSLPDGEDPDSFAQKYSSEELLEYIKQNESDFIHFKIKLLLSQAGNDPIERARLITDIIKSISLIPDSITRSVYIRSTSNMMEVDEKTIYTEVARRRGDKYAESSRQITSVNKNLKVKDTNSQEPSKNNHILCETEEMVLIRYLLLFGEKELYKIYNENDFISVKVGEYIMEELAEDDLELIHPLLCKIQKEYKENYQQIAFSSLKYFTGHPDPKVCAITAHILSEPYELSKIWQEKESVVVTEDMLLSELLPKVIDNYKMRRVEMMTIEADNKILELQQNGEPEEIVQWIKKKSTLNIIRKKLNQKLGRTGVK